jgi:hypothetical protein
MKKIALEMRVFGYKNSSQLELDSFILFVSEARMKVTQLLFLLNSLKFYELNWYMLLSMFICGNTCTGLQPELDL